MSRLQIAVVGFGALGRACVDAARDAPEVAIAGVVRRAPHPLPPPHARLVVADHVSGLGRVDAALCADPLFVGERTQVFQVPSVAELEDTGHGVLLERRAASGTGPHDTLLLEARCDPARFAGRLMVDAARALPGLPPGAHRYLPGM